MSASHPERAGDFNPDRARISSQRLIDPSRARLSLEVMEPNQETPLPVRGTPAPIKASNGASAETYHSAADRESVNGSAPGRVGRSAPFVNGESEPGHRLAQRVSGRDSDALKQLPDDPAVRDQITCVAETIAASLDQGRPISKRELADLGRKLLGRIRQPVRYLGYAMVMIGNAFWRGQFVSTPFERRLLLLPHLLPHAPGCPWMDADTTPSAQTPTCGGCALLCYQEVAERLGYQVLVADRSSQVLSAIVEGTVDGILGMARMNVLERAIDNALISGVPSFVVPLPEAAPHSPVTLRDHPLTDARIAEVLERYEPASERRTMSYVPLLRSSNWLFTRDFSRLLPRSRSRTPEAAASPMGVTEEVAYDWLANGGKRFRPFITLAAYDAMTGGRRVMPAAFASGTHSSFPDAVCRVAMAIEAFHKASLVHDDIQDDDQFRYGRETLHRSQGLGPAINIGDYLIGLGYRLVNCCSSELGADVACDIVHSMAEAHIKLCDGQGAEMAWQLDPDWSITPADTLQIYSLKTSPAFEAALYAGLRMAGPIESDVEAISAFARHLGVGFQVLNDLKDWRCDPHNKIVAGGDALAVRPTMLLALALDAASDGQRRELQDVYQAHAPDELRLARLGRLFTKLGAFARAAALIAHSRHQALVLRDEVHPPALRQLFGFLVDAVLAPEEKGSGLFRTYPKI